MFDYAEQIREFIKLNFSPSNPDNSNFKVSTHQLLSYLFQTFPVDCINDYDLNEILLNLGYQRFTYSMKTITIIQRKDDEPKEKIEYHLCFGWCLYTEIIPVTNDEK